MCALFIILVSLFLISIVFFYGQLWRPTVVIVENIPGISEKVHITGKFQETQFDKCVTTSKVRASSVKSICCANQLTGFCVRAILALNGLIQFIMEQTGHNSC